MAILIPNMEMPTSCSECPLEYDELHCRLTGTELWNNAQYVPYTEQRMPDCPLKEIPDVVYASGVDLGKEIIVPMRYEDDIQKRGEWE